MAGHFLCLGGDHLRKLKKYKPTKFKAKDSVYNKELADYAVSFVLNSRDNGYDPQDKVLLDYLAENAQQVEMSVDNIDDWAYDKNFVGKLYMSF